MRRSVGLILVLCLLLSITSPAYAANTEIDLNDLPNTYHSAIEGGDMFVQEADGKLVTILTNEAEQLVTISIKYDPASNTVYQWILESYPVNPFAPESLSFWTDIINYAEDRMDEAAIVEFEVESAMQNNARSSAGADLYNDLVSIVGTPYSDTLTEVRSIEGHTYRLYEALEFDIKNVTVNRWLTAITVASFITGIVGLTATSSTIITVCGIFGLATTTASTLIPAGSTNEYTCKAIYTRYITVDGSVKWYAGAYKTKSFKGYEDASDNSTGRAKIFGSSVNIKYTSTGDIYNTGLWDIAYANYNNPYY